MACVTREVANGALNPNFKCFLVKPNKVNIKPYVSSHFHNVVTYQYCPRASVQNVYWPLGTTAAIMLI